MAKAGKKSTAYVYIWKNLVIHTFRQKIALLENTIIYIAQVGLYFKNSNSKTTKKQPSQCRYQTVLDNLYNYTEVTLALFLQTFERILLT